MNPVSRRGFLGVLGATGAVAATAGLTGCAGSGGSSGSSSSGGSVDSLTFWSNHPGTSKDTEHKLIEAFQSRNAGVKVNLVDGGKNYEEVAQKLNAALTGNDVPDVVVISDVTWFNFALNKQLAPLDDLFAKAGVDTGDYVDSLLGDYVLDGAHYGIPFARSTPLFYYNKDAWKAAGLPDRGPETWEEFAEWAPRIQQALGGDKKAIGMADGSNYLDWTSENIVWAFDGAYSRDWTPTFTDPNTVKAVEFLKKLNDDTHLLISKDASVEFGSGLSGCCLSSTGSLSGITKAARFEFGTAFLPGAKAKKTCPTGGAGLAVPAAISDDRKVAALKFIGDFTSTQSTAIFAQATGYMPVRKSAKAAQEIKEYLAKTPQAATAIEQLDYTRPQDNARVFVPGGGKRIGGALDKILAGADVKATLDQVQKETQQIIDSQLKPKLGK